MFKVDFAVFENTNNRSLSDWLADLDRTTAQYSTFSVESVTEVSTPAPGIVRSTRVGGMPMIEYVFKSGQRLYRFSGFPTDSPVAGTFDSIVESLTLPQ